MWHVFCTQFEVTIFIHELIHQPPNRVSWDWSRIQPFRAIDCIPQHSNTNITNLFSKSRSLADTWASSYKSTLINGGCRGLNKFSHLNITLKIFNHSSFDLWCHKLNHVPLTSKAKYQTSKSPFHGWVYQMPSVASNNSEFRWLFIWLRQHLVGSILHKPV